MRIMPGGSYNISGNRKGWITIALHVLIWLMVFLIPYIFSAEMKRGPQRKENPPTEFLYLNTGINIFWVLLFYVNAGMLLPQLIYKRKVLFYVLALTGIFALVILFDNFLFHVFAIPRPFSLFHSVEHNLIPFLFTIAVSAAYKAISDKSKADILIREKQSENLKTELAFLRSQVSPHFLFNVLNNITALARIKSDELEPTVMKLSGLMRYQLYETDDDKVIIKNEVEYIRDYIDLQKQRYGEELEMSVTFDIKEEWHSIEPMLLIPFIENAFKHGGGLLQHPLIIIHLEVSRNELRYSVKNKYDQRETIKDRTSGIGLINVKRRLELLYPGKHELKIVDNDGWFNISLQIILT